ncbi:MAG: class I SAM-dependent methyltransferase [Desulfobacteraceae bacterium]|nr:class I SAM-dependent methyltransferase [Desulfobacteraceae bacterium]
MNKAAYDGISEEYKNSKQLPFRIYIEEFTIFQLLGNLKGKKVLDLACGEGIYSRKVKKRGADQVFGVDISSKMIELAEKENPLGCVYQVGDGTSLKKYGEFDFVLGSYLLNYAKTKEELQQFCQTICNNLKPGGSFVGFNDNPGNPVEYYSSYKKYGFWKETSPDRPEGATITYCLINPDGTEFSLDNYYLSKETYQKVFHETGFTELRWKGPWLSPEGEQEMDEGFWDNFLQNPPMTGILAKK